MEVASAGASALVRDSKDPEGPVLAFRAADWAAFISEVQDSAAYFSR